MLVSIFSFSNNFLKSCQTNFKSSVTFMFSSERAFSLDHSKILSFGYELIQAMPLLKEINLNNSPRERSLFKTFVEKGENADNQHFLLFPQCLLLYQEKFLHSGTIFYLSSAKVFNLDQSKVLFLRKDLTLS